MNRKNLAHLFIILLLLLVGKTFSQANFPADGPIYRDDMVPRVDISIHPDTLEWIYENTESMIEFRAGFIFTTDTISDTINDIGFRLRGNTSRESAKKSFKVSFNTFQAGRNYFGVEKLNLNGEHNDPSIIRAKIAWDLFRDFGIPAPRANHVAVYINGDYYGLYINVEHIDEEFAESRFGNKNGNLFKCLWPADLNFRGTDPENYKHSQGDRRVYELRTKILDDDYSDLADFITKLNQLPNTDFDCNIYKIFNVFDYLKVIAVDLFIGNWDGPIYNKNNFYLYRNTQYDRFEYIPYDLDNTFGIDWFNKDWKTRSIYEWSPSGSSRPIYSRMMEHQELRALYSLYTSQLMSDEFTGEDFINEILRIKDMIAPFVGTDPFYPLDYGYSIEDFHNSYVQALGDHVKDGLLPYIETRKTSTLAQLEEFNEQAVINHIRYKVKNNGSSLRVRAYVEEPVSQVSLIYSINDGANQSLELFDDGLHNDVLPLDGIYANTLSEIALNSRITYQIKADHVNGLEKIWPCDPNVYYYQPSTFPGLRINEFMASNDTTIANEYGDYSDWIEIYNADNIPHFLGNKYLTDNLSDRNKWKMPDIYLPAKSFVLFWADNDADKGVYHTNFKLSASGEEIGIYDADNTGFVKLDSVKYGVQKTDISQGRYKDGENQWRFYTIATPGYSNIFISVSELEEEKIFFYPNPNRSGILRMSKNADIKIFNLSGQLVLSKTNSFEINLSHLPNGVYLVQINEYTVQKLILH
jgi:spore coat protein H